MILGAGAPGAREWSTMEETLPKTANAETARAKSGEVIRGSVRAEFRRCGKRGCRCANAGDPGHGPYYYRYFRVRGRLTKRYVPREQAAAVAAACRTRREARREGRRLIADCLAAVREVNRMLRGSGGGGSAGASDRDRAELLERLYGK